MVGTSHVAEPGASGVQAHPAEQFTAPLRRFREALASSRPEGHTRQGAPAPLFDKAERLLSAAAGSMLALAGLRRRDVPGTLLAGFGAALIYRGASGRVPLSRALGYSTAGHSPDALADRSAHRGAELGVHVRQSLLINKSPEELYDFWRNFENLPQVMSHLKSVRRLDERRSHWVASAPAIAGGAVEWDAEITDDEPNSRISWRTVEGADVAHRGSVCFQRALGDRGTAVRIELHYQPPAGAMGRWFAKLFGEEPQQQIREDLRNFKRRMEIGEVISLEGQPRGSCHGRGKRA
ncbi:MAG: SRPBCC family protein [Pirellulales bacterium]|nr:SRPBCC family protein [Pirellulales bacterium]